MKSKEFGIVALMCLICLALGYGSGERAMIKQLRNGGVFYQSVTEFISTNDMNRLNRKLDYLAIRIRDEIPLSGNVWFSQEWEDLSK